MPKFHVTLADVVLNTWEVEVDDAEGFIVGRLLTEIAEDKALDQEGTLIDSRPATKSERLTDIFDVKQVD